MPFKTHTELYLSEPIFDALVAVLDKFENDPPPEISYDTLAQFPESGSVLVPTHYCQNTVGNSFDHDKRAGCLLCWALYLGQDESHTHLFYPNGAHYLFFGETHDQTTTKAAKVLREFLETGIVTWNKDTINATMK